MGLQSDLKDFEVTTEPYRQNGLAFDYDRTNTESLEELRDRAAKIASEIKVH